MSRRRADERDRRSATSGRIRRRSRARAGQSRDRGRRLRLDGRPVGLRQEHLPAHVLGQERPTRGGILLDGEPLPAEPGPDRGVVFQRYSVFPHLTVLGNVLLGLEFAQQARCRRACSAPARRAGDRKKRSHARERRPRPRIATNIRRAVRRHAAAAGDRAGAGARPRVLLLDEPFGALDPGTRARCTR